MGLKHKNSMALLVPYLSSPLMVLTSLFMPVALLVIPFIWGRMKSGTLLKLLLEIFLCGIVSWLPILYFIFGWEDDHGVKVTDLMLFTPYVVLWLYGVMFSQQHLLEGCENAVDKAKTDVKNNSTEVAQELIRRACDPTDARSYYPVILSSGEDEPRERFLPRRVKVRVICISCITCLIILKTILFFLMGIEATGSFGIKVDTTHYHGMRLFHVGLWPWLLTFNSALSATGLMYIFFNEVEIKSFEFRDCVWQMQIFHFLSITPGMRKSLSLQARFVDILKRTAARRQMYAGKGVFTRGAVADPFGLLDIQTSADQSESRRICAPELLDEVKKWTLRPQEKRELPGKKGTKEFQAREEFTLQSLRFTLNLSNIQGVDLHRMIHRWMCIDCENERFAADVSANLVLAYSLLLLVRIAVSLFQHEMVPTENNVIAILVFLVLVGYFLKICNLCIEMNEVLFNEIDVCLLEWMDVQTKPYIAKLWDRTKKEEYVYLAEKTGISPERVPLETRAMLQISRERIRMLDKPSALLGMSITKALRNRILTLFVTAGLGALTGIAKKHLVGS